MELNSNQILTSNSRTAGQYSQFKTQDWGIKVDDTHRAREKQKEKKSLANEE